MSPITSTECAPTHPVKGFVTRLDRHVYFGPEHPSYAEAPVTMCFVSEAAAVDGGYQPSQWHRTNR
jgi:hypothetical protein